MPSDEVARIVRERQLAEMTAARVRAEQLAHWRDLGDQELLEEVIGVDEAIARYERVIRALRDTKAVGVEVGRERGLVE